MVLLLRCLICRRALYSYFARLFPHSLVFNDFVMPSLFAASSLLIPHKSIRFYTFVSKARVFGCRMGLGRKCFISCLNIVHFFPSFTLQCIVLHCLNIVHFGFTHFLWRCMTPFKGSLLARQTNII